MPRWNFHCYISKDNNLFESVQRDLSQFATADRSKVRVAVQVDTPEGRAERHIFLRSGKFGPLPPIPPTDHNLNSGDRQILVNFLIAARHLAETDAGRHLGPDDSTTVVLNSHGIPVTDLNRFRRGDGNGNGTRLGKVGAFALGVDESSHDFLDNNEMDDALRRAHEGHPKFDIIGMDACLMAMVEVAHQLRQHGTYFVASQDNEGLAGWPYDQILKTFNDQVDAQRAATNIVHEYGDATRNDDEATLSAVALDTMDALATTLDNLGAALKPFIPNEIRLLARARQDARVFSNFDSIDLYAYVEALKERITQSVPDNATRRTILAAADAVLSILDHAIIATSKTPTTSGAHGLSVYLPNSPVIAAYHELPLSKAAPRWHDFVSSYAENREFI